MGKLKFKSYTTAVDTISSLTWGIMGKYVKE